MATPLVKEFQMSSPFIQQQTSLPSSSLLPFPSSITMNSNNNKSKLFSNNYQSAILRQRLLKTSSNHYSQAQIQSLLPPQTTVNPAISTTTRIKKYPNMKNNFIPRRSQTTTVQATSMNQEQQDHLHHQQQNPETTPTTTTTTTTTDQQQQQPSRRWLKFSFSTQNSGFSRARTALGLDRPFTIPTSEEIVDKLLHPQEKPEMMSTNPSRQKFLNMNYETRLKEEVMSVIQQMWAPSTLKSRQLIWIKFEHFCKVRNYKLPQEMDFAIPMFCEFCKKLNKLLKESSRLQYSKSLSAIAGRFSIPVPITRMYQIGLRALGADMPSVQAPAITHPLLTQLVQHALLHPRAHLRQSLYTTIYLMYKTASRFDEVSNLTHHQVRIISNNEIVISWINNTKSTRTQNQFRADNVINVYDENSHPQIVLQVLQELRQRPILLYWTVTAFDKWIKTLPPPLPTYTAHSIKAFSVTLLSLMAAHGHIPKFAVAVMAKHKIEHPDLLPATTNRYIRDPEVKSLLNPSRTATNLLKWTEDPTTQLMEKEAINNNTPYHEDTDSDDPDMDMSNIPNSAMEDQQDQNQQQQQMMMMMNH